MTNKEFLANAKVGSIITNKQLLATLKRKGLIFGYSAWGYLESCRVDYMQNGERIYYSYEELFPNGNAPKDESCINADYDGERFGGAIEYMGCKFDTKYLDGCFCPYLQLTAKGTDVTKVVEPRMSVYGNVI